MFSRQRRNYKIFLYAALTVALCVLIVLLFWPKEPRNEDTPNVTNNQQEQQTDEYEDDITDDLYDEESDNPDEENEEEYSEDDYVNNDKLETFYLIKKDGDKIKVFFSDKYGDLIELEETAIIYDLLPAEDQTLFEEGLRANTQEELSSILMNYES